MFICIEPLLRQTSFGFMTSDEFTDPKLGSKRENFQAYAEGRTWMNGSSESSVTGHEEAAANEMRGEDSQWRSQCLPDCY